MVDEVCRRGVLLRLAKGLTSMMSAVTVRGCRQTAATFASLFDNRIGNLDVRGELDEPVPVRGAGESLTRTIQ